MRKTLMVAAALLAIGGTRAEAQARFGANLSWGDDTDIGLGARVGFPLGKSVAQGKIDGLVTFDYFFPSAFNVWEVAGNGIYNLTKTGSVAPYLGAGLGLQHWSYDNPVVNANSTDAFVNLLGGLRFKPTGNVQPFAEARLELGSGSQLVLTGGVFFGRSSK